MGCRGRSASEERGAHQTAPAAPYGTRCTHNQSLARALRPAHRMLLFTFSSPLRSTQPSYTHTATPAAAATISSTGGDSGGGVTSKPTPAAAESAGVDATPAAATTTRTSSSSSSDDDGDGSGPPPPEECNVQENTECVCGRCSSSRALAKARGSTAQAQPDQPGRKQRTESKTATPLNLDTTQPPPPHNRLWGDVVRWGANFRVKSAGECCDACLKALKPSGKQVHGCNVWVWCGDKELCKSQYHECWLKHLVRGACMSNKRQVNGLAFGLYHTRLTTHISPSRLTPLPLPPPRALTNPQPTAPQPDPVIPPNPLPTQPTQQVHPKGTKPAREGPDVGWTSGIVGPDAGDASEAAAGAAGASEAVISGPPRRFHVVTSAQGSAVHWQVRVHYYWCGVVGLSGGGYAWLLLSGN